MNLLFGAIEDQSLCFFCRNPDLPLYAQNPPRQTLDPLQAPADRPLVHPVQAGQKILGNVAAVNNQQGQQMLFMPAPASAGAAKPPFF